MLEISCYLLCVESYTKALSKIRFLGGIKYSRTLLKRGYYLYYRLYFVLFHVPI